MVPDNNPDVSIVDVLSRKDVENVVQQDASAIVFKCHSRSDRSAELFPNETASCDSTYELRMLLSDTSSIYIYTSWKQKLGMVEI